MPIGSYVLITPAFAPDGSALALVLSISVPTATQTITKQDPATGQPSPIQAVTRVSHHELAYFNPTTASFAGPFDLADGPSLARVNAATDGKQLLVWTLVNPRTLTGAIGSQARDLIPQLTGFPVGSGTARFSVAAPGPWPVNGEPIVTLASGEFARLAYCQDVEVYSPTTGGQTRITPAALQLGSAKPGTPTMDTLSDGTVFITNSTIGTALIADPASGFAPIHTLTFPVPMTTNTSGRSVVLSGDAQTLFVLGSSDVRGVAAYDVRSNSPIASYTSGKQYQALYALPDGGVVAAGPAHPRLTLFSHSLEPVGTLDADIYVANLL